MARPTNGRLPRTSMISWRATSHDGRVRTTLSYRFHTSSRTSPVTQLIIERLFKTYRDRESSREVPAIRGIDLAINSGELISLLGPSGCGKTSTLRCIAGFETPDAASIRVDGE